MVRVGEEVGDAGGEGFGLARAGWGEDLQDGGGGGDGGFLCGVEAFENQVHFRGGAGPGQGRVLGEIVVVVVHGRLT